MNKSSVANSRAATHFVNSVPWVKNVKGMLIQPLKDAENPDMILAFPSNAINA